VVVSQEFMSHF
jgi:CCR4-NOT transcription complex subunit 1